MLCKTTEGSITIERHSTSNTVCITVKTEDYNEQGERQPDIEDELWLWEDQFESLAIAIKNMFGE
jgi:hypothetical protein